MYDYRITRMDLIKHRINVFLTVLTLILFCIIVYMIGTSSRIYRIVGHSMNPTLYEKNIVITQKQKEYKRGDIIAFEKDGSNTIKRIIGLPGDKVFIDDDGYVYINDEILPESYVMFHQMQPPSVIFPITVPRGQYFVLGDNRQNSRDSRETSFGYVNEKEILGKVIRSLIPFKEIK